MALIKLGPLIGGISGDVAGLNFVTSSKRIVVRPQRRRVNNDMRTLQPQRARLAYLVNLWTAQTANTRNAWQTLAAQQRVIDRIGQARNPTGRQFFLSHNLRLLQAGLTLNTTTVPTPTTATTWTGQGLSIPNGLSALYTPINPLFGPYVDCSIYAQTFFRPTPQIPDTFSSEPTKLPNKWVFVKHHPSSLGNTALELFPQLGNILGPIAVGQRVALFARWCKSGNFSTSSHTSINTR